MLLRYCKHDCNDIVGITNSTSLSIQVRDNEATKAMIDLYRNDSRMLFTDISSLSQPLFCNYLIIETSEINA